MLARPDSRCQERVFCFLHAPENERSGPRGSLEWVEGRVEVMDRKKEDVMSKGRFESMEVSTFESNERYLNWRMRTQHSRMIRPAVSCSSC